MEEKHIYYLLVLVIGSCVVLCTAAPPPGHNSKLPHHIRQEIWSHKGCSENQFKCANGSRCLPSKYWCDKVYQCEDHSDEPENCSQACLPGQISCDDRCVAQSLQCDGIQHCTDFSDERHCNNSCWEWDFMCPGSVHKCLAISKWCDGIMDCPEGDDELSGCLQVCPDGFYLCPDEIGCVSAFYICSTHMICPEFDGNCSLITKKCGVQAIKPHFETDTSGISFLIVDGEEAKPHSWPWQARILYNDDHWCSASIISDQWLITAAHCLKYKPMSSISHLLGDHHLNINEQSQTTYQPQKFIIHPRYIYRNGAASHDIALIWLSTKIKFQDEIDQVCLPQQGQDVPVGQECVVTGWGQTLGTGDDSVLNEATVDVMSQRSCQLQWGSELTEYMMCAGTGKQRTCNGDSGGPLVCRLNGQWTLYGVVSWGSYGCDDPPLPSVFTRVTKYVDWIWSTITETETKARSISTLTTTT